MPTIDLKTHKPKAKAAPASPGQGQGLITFLNKDISFGSGELSDKKKEAFYLEMSSLLEAGVNLKSSLELITVGQEKEKDRALFKKIQEMVFSGGALSEALTKSKKFSVYEIYSLQIGEETGKITEILTDLASFYQNKIRQRRKIVSSLTYPAVVLTASLGAIIFMMKVIVPMFGDVFKRFGGHLPWITEKILGISQAMGSAFWPVFIFLAVLVATGYYFKNTIVFRRISSRVIQRIPVVGIIVQKIYLARYCNSMRLLISARLPLLRAIELCKQMIGFYPIESSLSQVQTDITSGKSLHESMQLFAIYPAKMIQLIKVGEETNQMDHFFGKISQQYVDEVEYKTSTLSSVMEPLIIAFLGLMVGVILISMYLPLFQMSNNIQ